MTVRRAEAAMLLEAATEFLEAARRIEKRRRLAKLEARFAAMIGPAFVAQGNALTRRLTATGVLREAGPVPEVDWALIERFFDQAIDETRILFTTPAQAMAAQAMLTAAADLLPSLAPDAAVSFTLENPRAVAYLDNVGADLVRNVNETTRKEIRRIVSEGAKQGKSVSQIAKEITAKFEDFAAPRPQGHIKNRAELVAETELGNAYEEGNEIAAQQLADAGYIVEHAWQTVGDERVSPECQLNQAAGWIPLDQAFPGGQKRPLAHPA